MLPPHQPQPTRAVLYFLPALSCAWTNGAAKVAMLTAVEVLRKFLRFMEGTFLKVATIRAVACGVRRWRGWIRHMVRSKPKSFKPSRTTVLGHGIAEND